MNIINQRRTVEALKSTIASERIAHAYLFIGPDGVGKRAVAIEYGKTLLCERGGTEPCDRCLPCTKVNRMVHPDLHILFPYPSDTDTKDVAERIQLLGENPYAAVDFVRRPTLGDPTKSSNKQALYTVARMHEEVRREMSFKPVEGKYKIAILTDADLLRTEAANAFLKLLEEPAPRTIFILTTSRPDRMLPTILSRCQRFRFDPLSPEAIEEALIGREGIEPAFAAAVARMADGSYTAALDLAQNEELRGLRDLVLDFFRMSYAQDVNRLTDLIEKTARLGRDQVKHVLDLMLRWIRDVVLYRSLGSEAHLVNVDQMDAVAKFNDNLPNADLEAMASAVEEAVGLIGRNVHVTLTLTVLSQTLAAAMRGAESGPLYLPLSEEPLRMVG